LRGQQNNARTLGQSNAGDTGVVAANCFKCKKVEVLIARAQDDAIVWSCPRCNVEGRISNWQGTLWDLSNRPDASH
jgi:hypothetical protein